MRTPGKPGRPFLGTFVSLLLLCGCGQSGPLYLPDDDGAEQAPEPGNTITEEEDIDAGETSEEDERDDAD